MTVNTWEEIRSFVSLAEYQRFVRYIEAQVAAGFAEEVPVDPTYGPGLLFGGRWFKNNDTGEVWRLIEPDVPFKGRWEPVRDILPVP